jgi:8-oxo-dGTP diphosphatase
MSEVRTKIIPPGSIEQKSLTYVVMGARQGTQWIFVRHSERSTWEMPAGHIEAGESPDQAAVRELYEETGTVGSKLNHLCDYEVTFKGRTEYGRLYLAEVHQREAIPDHEIGEIRFGTRLPENLTYPEVQTVLFERVAMQFPTGDQSEEPGF